MPNYTWTTIEADKDVIAALLDENGNFTFNKFIPRPKDLENTTAGGDVNYLIALYLIETYTKKLFFEILNEMNCSLYGVYFRNYDTKATIKAKLLERLGDRRTDEITDGYGADAKVLRVLTGKDYFNLWRKYGYYDWYRWSLDKWGTKWDAFDVNVSETTINFTTAWSMPEPIIKKICQMFPDREINFTFEYEEGYLTEAENNNGELSICSEWHTEYPEDEDGVEDLEDWENGEWVNDETGERKPMYE